MIRMMNTSDSFIGPVNIGNSNEFSIKELAEKIIKTIGSKSKLIYLPLPQDDPTQRQPDISLAKKMLNNWEPKVEIDEGLRKTVEYFKNI